MFDFSKLGEAAQKMLGVMTTKPVNNQAKNWNETHSFTGTKKIYNGAGKQTGEVAVWRKIGGWSASKYDGQGRLVR